MTDGFFRRAAASWIRFVPDPRRRSLFAIATQLAAIPCLMLICVWLYTHGLQFAWRLIPVADGAAPFPIYLGLLARGLLPACLVAGVLCYPLALLYRRFAPAAALMCCLPFIAIWTFLNPYRSTSLIQGVLHGYEQISLLVLMIGGSWLARASLSRRAAPRVTVSL